jgi:hypothetical protein
VMPVASTRVSHRHGAAHRAGDDARALAGIRAIFGCERSVGSAPLNPLSSSGWQGSNAAIPAQDIEARHGAHSAPQPRRRDDFILAVSVGADREAPRPSAICNVSPQSTSAADVIWPRRGLPTFPETPWRALAGKSSCLGQECASEIGESGSVAGVLRLYSRSDGARLPIE